MASVLSVNVGLPKDVAWQGKTVYTGVWKQPGGRPARWSAASTSTATARATWPGTAASSAPCSSTRSSPTVTGSSTSAATTSSYGAFGENLTVDGLADDEVCIGDRYRIGEAEFEVTQPRVTCYRVGLRLGEPRTARAAGRPPPSRLLHAGPAPRGASRPVTRSSRPGPGPHALSVADVDALLYLPGRDLAKLRVARADPGAQPGLAAVVPRLWRRRGRRPASGRPPGRPGPGSGRCG